MDDSRSIISVIDLYRFFRDALIRDVKHLAAQ